LCDVIFVSAGAAEEKKQKAFRAAFSRLLPAPCGLVGL
jgi:hypothetical protein